MFDSFFNEATETSIVPINLLRIFFCEGKKPSSFVVIVDDVAKEVKTQTRSTQNHQRFLLAKKNYQYMFKQGCDYKILS